MTTPARVETSRRGQAFAILCVHTFLFQAITFLLRPTASYRAVELGEPTAWLGVLAASFAAVPLLVALPAGDASDRWGERRVMLTGTVVIGLSSLLFLFGGRSFAGLVVGTMVLGTGHLLCTVGQQAMVANLFPRGRLDSAFGYYTFAGSLGQAAGPGVMGLFGPGGSVPDTHAVFVVSVALSAVLVAVTAFARSSRRPARSGHRDARKISNLLRINGLTRALVVSSVVLASMDLTLVYLPALGASTGLPVGFIGALLTLRAVSSMASRLFLGRLVDLVGRRVMLAASIGLSGLATALLPFPVRVWVLGAAVIVMGFGLGVCQPLTLSWLAEVAPAGLRGRVMSMRLIGNRFGQVVIPLSVGVVSAGLGAAGVLWIVAGSLVGASALCRTVPLDNAKPAEP